MQTHLARGGVVEKPDCDMLRDRVFCIMIAIDLSQRTHQASISRDPGGDESISRMAGFTMSVAVVRT